MGLNRRPGLGGKKSLDMGGSRQQRLHTLVSWLVCSLGLQSVAISDEILSRLPESACSNWELVLTEPGKEPRISRDTIGGMLGQD